MSRPSRKRSAADARLDAGDDTPCTGGGGGAAASAAAPQRPPPPPTIRFSDGQAVSPPPDWASDHAAAEAARYKLDVMRLVGSTTLTFTATLQSQPLQRQLERLSCPVYVTPTPPYKDAPASAGLRTWDNKGEPSSWSTIPVHRLLAALAAGQLVPVAEHTVPFLEACNGLIVPGKLWKCPLARCVVHGHVSTATPETHVLTCEVHVYLSRLAFELIACDDIAVMMRHLQPCVPIVTPLQPMASYPQTLFSAPPPADEDPFTSASLLRGMEHTGYREEPQPRGVELPMFSYQRQALAWMRDQESRACGLNSGFWETRSWADSGVPGAARELWWYFPLAGEFRLAQPPGVTGGLLCQEMGLGKTLAMTALLVADKPAAQQAAQQPLPPPQTALLRSSATLVVMPTTLLAQWRRELAKSTSPGLLRVVVYPPEGSEQAGRLRVSSEAIAELASHDVVLSSYKALENESSGRGHQNAKVLTKIHWRRIALDECQEVRSNTTQLARTAAALSGDHRWLISGTPMHTGVDDVNGELMFLSVWPFALSNATDGFWKEKITKAMNQRQPGALHLLRALLSGVALRHSKSQTDAGGRKLTDLPPLTKHLRPVELSGSDGYCVKALECYAARVLGIANDLGFMHEIAPPRKRSDESDGAFSARLSAHKSKRAACARATQVAQSLLALLRDSCTAIGMPYSVAGAVASAHRGDGSGLKAFLKDVDRLIRAALHGVFDIHAITASGTVTGPSHSGAGGGGGILSIPAMSASQALNEVMRADANQGNAREREAGLVRHGEGAAVGAAAYDTNRTYATVPLGERLSQALIQLAQVEARRAREGAVLRRLRWHLVAANERPALVEQPRYLAFLRRAAQAKAAVPGGAPAVKSAVAEVKRAVARLNEATDTATQRAHRRAVDEAVQAVIQRGKAEVAVLTASYAACCQDAAANADLVSLLQRAISAVGANAELSHITQTGYQGLHDLAEGRVAPTCPICMQQAVNPVVTPCVHISCAECILTWLDASRSAGRPASCPLCRKTPLYRADLIRIITEPTSEPKAAPAPVPSSSDGAGPSNAASRAGTAFCPAATEAEVAALLLAPKLAAVTPMGRDRAYPSIPAPLLTHTHAARTGNSPKIAAVLHDLASILHGDATAKAVVFSQSPASVMHVSCLLQSQGTGCVRIQVSMPEPERARAVQQFNDNPSVRVLVLHVSTAAAGLTLTSANHVLLLEPFLCDNDEAQAISRVHRIGQTKPVFVKQYYVRNTVEERLLAHRHKERIEAVQGGTESAEAMDVMAASLGAEAQKVQSGAKLLFCFGLEPAPAPPSDDADTASDSDDM